MRIIVAGFGNVLRSDDAFGVAVVDRLAALGAPRGVEVLDIGIGGIHLVQQLGEPAVHGLVVVDAVDLGRRPGTVLVVDPDVPDLTDLPTMQLRDHLADMHYATPDRALMLARAMDVLPERTVVVGCQPVDADTPHQGMSPVVEAAVDVAAREVRRVVSEFGVPWEEPVS